MPSSNPSRRLGFVSAAIVALSAASLAVGVLASSCSDDTTSSKRVVLKTRVTADEEVTSAFTNARGWSIRLSRAAVSIGALYYFDGAPIFTASRSPRRPESRAGALAHFLGIASAYAHPGHYVAGTAMGEVLNASSADLMTGFVELPAGEGVAGIYRSGRFTFNADPVGSAVTELGAHVVVVEGQATKETLTRTFRAVADVDDVLDSYGEPKLEGCSFDDEPDIQDDGTVTVHIKPSVWLDQSDFTDVPEGAPDAPVELTPDEEAFLAFVRGLKKSSSVRFSYSK